MGNSMIFEFLKWVFQTDGPTDLAQILHTKLVRGFDHERDILGLKSIFVENYGSRPFGDPQEHGNEAG